ERKPLVQEYFPNEDETMLYNWVTDYLQRPKLYALPFSQRQLMTLILRKLLASSTYAIFGTLDALVKRLENILINHDTIEEESEMTIDFETYDEIQDEWESEEDDDPSTSSGEAEDDFEEVVFTEE